MTGTNAYKYKDSPPLETVRRVQNILFGLGVMTEERWMNELDGFYSVIVRIYGTNLGATGKGSAPELALASGYGELMERLQGFEMNGMRVNAGPGALRYGGFRYAPDEKQLSLDEIAGLPDEWVDIVACGAGAKDEKRERLRAWLLDQESAGSGQLLSLPYLRISDGSIRYIPEIITQTCYGSNGFCAGNTREEALVQGISEILERYSNIRTILGKLTPPSVPEAYVRKFPQVHGMIESIQKAGNLRVIVKDCSLGEGLPVVGVLAVDMDTHSYFVKFGAHPAFEIALERCLTELMQCRSLQNRSWMVQFAYPGVRARTDSFSNINQILFTGYGRYPKEFFGNKSSYPFTERDSADNLNNGDMLSRLIDLILKRGREIYIRETSFLGFPSFHVIIPGMGETFHPMSISETAGLRKTLNGIGDTVKRLGEATDEELRRLAGYIREYCGMDTSLMKLTDIQAKESFPWNGVKTGLVLASAYYRLGMMRESHEAMKQFVQTLDGKSASYYRCVRDYIGARADGMADADITQLLNVFYSEKLVDKVISDLRDPGRIFRNFMRVSCYECDHCEFRTHCHYPATKEIILKLKDRYAGNPIDQARNRDLMPEKHAQAG